MRNTILALLMIAAACGKDAVTPDATAGHDSSTAVDSSSTGDGPPSQLTCANYCSTIATNCTAVATKQYANTAECMATCSHFPVGALADTSGNTLGCHLYHAGNAMAAPTVHCIHAGPSGAGVCGASCEDFCALTTAICPTQYPALGSCMTSCGNFATTPAYSTAQMSGNTFSCRMYHATAASTTPVPHCAHTAVTPTAPCT